MRINSSNLTNGLALVTSVTMWFGLLWQPNLAQASCVPPPAGLVAWWPGDGTANDVIGGNNGTLTNGAAFAAGEVGQGFSFGTHHAGVLLGNPPNLQSQNFTIETWIRRASTNDVTTDPVFWGGIFSDTHAVIFGYGSQGYALGMAGSDSNCQGCAGWLFLEKVGGLRISAGPLITDTNLHHVAVTRSGTSVIFYVDGLGYPFPGSVFSESLQFTTQASIGFRTDRLFGSEHSFYGTVDELCFYNRPLAAEEIAAVYAAGSAGKCRPAAPANMTIDRDGGISVVGTVGATYSVQCVPDLSGTNWTTFTNFVLPQSPYRVFYPNAPQTSCRFYRVQSGGQ